MRKNILVASIIFLSCCSFALMLFGNATTVAAQELYTNTPAEEKPLRLHILANSNNEFDQQLKLNLRDHIIVRMEEILAHAETKQEAIDDLTVALPELTASCNDYLALRADYQAVLSIERDDFPSIDYNGMIFAAGEYDALRVILGEGAGHNWWCVLFPPLCFVDLAIEADDNAVTPVMTGTTESGCRVDFKLRQLWQKQP